MTNTSEYLVDVGIPAYGRPTYLIEAIRSVLAQRFTAWRLTISDDTPNGGDDVRKAVEQFLDDPRIRYVATDGGIGEIPNTNRLITMADARYLVILHDDDRLHDNYLDRRVAFLESHSECALCFSGCAVIDESGQMIYEWHSSVAEGVSEPAEFIPRMLWHNEVGAPVAALVRRSAYDMIGGYFSDKPPYSDYEIWMRLALKWPVGYLTGVDADYRFHSGSASVAGRPSVSRVVFFSNHMIELVRRSAPALLPRDTGPIRANLILGEIHYDLRRGGNRTYATSLLIHAVRAHPRAIFDRRVISWMKILVGRRPTAILGQIRRRLAASSG